MEELKTKQEVELHYAKCEELKSFIVQNDFNDELFRNKFDETDYKVLNDLAFLCWHYSKKSEDITYAEQTKQIAHTIMEKETISYKQFRVLCFFWKRHDYRKNNPLRKEGDKPKLSKKLLHKQYVDNMGK